MNVRIIPAERDLAYYDVDDGEWLLEGAKKGTLHADGWVETKDGQFVQIRHITRMFKFE